MESSNRYPCRKQVPWRVIDAETLVVDVKSGLLYPLNSVGTRIWELCDGRRTVEEIVQIIAAEFDAELATIREDTSQFVQELERAVLIKIDKEPHTPLADAPGASGAVRGA